MVISVCGYTIFYQTDNNVLPSIEHKVKLKVSGVPQGSVLGHLLFLIQISDINYEIADSIVSCTADDTWILWE